MCYSVHNSEHLVGVMGIISPGRWYLGLATGLLGVKYMVERLDVEEIAVIVLRAEWRDVWR